VDNREQRDRKRLADLVRDQIDGEELVRLLVAIVRGERRGEGRPTIAARVEATKLLFEIGWGKPVQPIRVIVKGKTGVPLPLAPMLASLWDN
jgi:hypothetical protein